MKRWLMKYTPAVIVCMAICLPFLHGQGSPNTEQGEASNAVPPVIRASVTPDSISIGDHFTLEITVDKDIMQVVDFPAFEGNMVSDQIELLAEAPVDTIGQNGRRIEIRKRYKLTTFDEGYYNIGKIPVMWIDKNITDTLYSIDSLKLTVTTFAIDTAKQTIYDIKPIAKAPFHPMEILLYVLLYFVIIRPLIICISVALILRKRKKEVKSGKLKPSEPPHVTAIRNLEMLHNQKLWQNNKHKFYYTRLTDILREYMAGRYDINAMEMTSDEIIETLSELGIAQKYYADLDNILREADLVKFAKDIPDAETNEKVYFDAYYFIENTKPTEVEKIPAAEDNGLKPYE